MKCQPFKSSLAHHLSDYWEYKTNLGHAASSIKSHLHDIDDYALRINYSDHTISNDFVTGWSKSQITQRPQTIYEKFSTLSQLCRFISRKGIECAVVMPPKKPMSTFIPYIFTQEEIRKLFKASDELISTFNAKRSVIFAFPAILRTLYSTGMRISEALSLRNQDINLDKDYILIRTSKNRTQRLVPISRGLKEVFLRYLKYRDNLPVENIHNPQGFFFVRPNGKRIEEAHTYNTFIGLFVKCGIKYQGDHHGPRLHDLRHTFATHSLAQMTKAGMEITDSLAILSACMGHKSLESTEYYIKLTQEYFPELDNLCKKSNEFIFPSNDYNN